MAFEDDIVRHVDQLKSRLPHVHGEEATKQALVLPFLQVLGYDVYDPREVQPEYVADFAEKKTRGQMEKIDYAIRINGEPAIFIECKAADVELVGHEAQLARYFNATPSVRVGILTNGVTYKVFTDLQQQNIMDEKPWLDFDLRSAKPAELDALKHFRKTDFVTDQVVQLAEDMVYYNVLYRFVSEQLRDPSEQFVRFVAKEIPTIGHVTSRVVERITPILRKAVHASILGHIERSFRPPTEAQDVEQPAATPQPPASTTSDQGSNPQRIEGFNLISKLIKETHPDAILNCRDGKSYCTVIQQKNSRKWFLRLSVDKPPFWLAVRHVAIEDARRLCPTTSLTEGGQAGDSRIIFGALTELTAAKPLLIASYEAEMARVTDSDASGEFDVATH